MHIAHNPCRHATLVPGVHKFKLLSKIRFRFQSHDPIIISSPCILVEFTGRLRLVNGTQIQSSAGRLEIYLSGRWGTICDVGFGLEDATLACNQLGYETYQRYGTVGQLG